MDIETQDAQTADEFVSQSLILDLGAPKVLKLVLELKQYPILSSKIRERMRQEILARGVITPEALEEEAKEKARDSQMREGIISPSSSAPDLAGVESPDIWLQRLSIIKDDLTDFYFAHNCPHTLFEQIVQEMVSGGTPNEELVLTFNPELAPWAMLFALGEQYESYPPEQKTKIQHHLQEIVVVLSKGMISDQLDFARLARQHLSIADLKEIRGKRIGRGKIGGKAAGLMMAWKILQQVRERDPDGPASQISIPDSYFIGADVFYEFQALNDLIQFMNQKYKSREEIEADYPHLQQAYIGGKFPQYVIEELEGMLAAIGKTPIVVRSSSLLEDNFGFSFAGKYESFFLPNQGTSQENLHALTRAISAIYASVVSPDALIYRRRMGLLDYDERMAVLIQKVVGMPYKDYYFPALAGVAFSRNPFRWNPRVRREDGLVRLVWGLGTRAVERVDNDYPRMIALSHPTLRPEIGVEAIRYSQHLIDLLNLRTNSVETRYVPQVLDSDYPGLNLLASVDKGGYLQPILSLFDTPDPSRMVLTFDNLIGRTDFVAVMKYMLQTVEKNYNRPVDIEFAARQVGNGRCEITLLQCRPLSFRQEGQPIRVPAHVPPDDIIFTANKLVPQGIVSDVRYIIWINPSVYNQIPDPVTKLELAKVVGKLNHALEHESFILMGPGRWGSSNLELGVKVTYADINNTRMLVEVALARGNQVPEVSYGTHFFQDLVESQIYPLPLYPDDTGVIFNWAFFENTPNALLQIASECTGYARYIKVIDVPAVSSGHCLEVVMDGEAEKAMAYIKH